MNAFMKFQAAQAMREAASAGGEAGGAMQAGLGAGFGMMMPGMIKEAMGASAPQTHADAAQGAGAAAAAAARFCSQCGKPVQPDSKFCAACGAKLA
jgi:membrane protease subunit (stomatin/prohibitin family)